MSFIAILSTFTLTELFLVPLWTLELVVIGYHSGNDKRVHFFLYLLPYSVPISSSTDRVARIFPTTFCRRRDGMSLSGFEPRSLELYRTGTFWTLNRLSYYHCFCNIWAHKNKRHVVEKGNSEVSPIKVPNQMK